MSAKVCQVCKDPSTVNTVKCFVNECNNYIHDKCLKDIESNHFVCKKCDQQYKIKIDKIMKYDFINLFKTIAFNGAYNMYIGLGFILYITFPAIILFLEYIGKWSSSGSSDLYFLTIMMTIMIATPFYHTIVNMTLFMDETYNLIDKITKSVIPGCTDDQYQILNSATIGHIHGLINIIIMATGTLANYLTGLEWYGIYKWYIGVFSSAVLIMIGIILYGIAIALSWVPHFIKWLLPTTVEIIIDSYICTKKWLHKFYREEEVVSLVKYHH